MQKHWMGRLAFLVLLVAITSATSACSGVEATATITPARTDSAVTQVSPKDGMVQVFVPEGNFLMGVTDEKVTRLCEKLVNNPDCPSWFEDQKPQHTVWLDGFWIDRFEVTNTQYAKCVADSTCLKPYDKKPKSSEVYYGVEKYANSPVTYLDWDMAATYCKWAGRRLPTEAEWEKAARGTDARLYPWGNEAPSCKLANYLEKKYCYGYTSPVGSYPDGASPYGAMDMAGNVLEWTADRYGAAYYSNSPSRNPSGPESGEARVLRSSAWDIFVWELSSTYRTADNHGSRIYNYGVRCAANR